MLSKNDTRPSQIGQNRVNEKSTSRRTIFIVFAAILWLIFITQSALAAEHSSFKHERHFETHKVTLADLSVLHEPRLDWRNPKYEVIFEMPRSDWIENIEFFVRLHAEGKVDRNTPVYVQFNDGEPTPIYAKGNSFEARINLETSYVKSYRNTISVSFGSNDGCIEAADGAFSIDMKDSFVVVKSSTPSQTYYLRDVKQILQSPLTAPKTVSLNAFGPDKLKYEALAAQGIALNMPSLPRFKIDSNADVKLYIGTRNELSGILKSTEIARKKGPAFGVVRNTPLSLVLTADNRKELDGLVKAFASKSIPAARRHSAYSGEFSWQTPFSVENAPIEGTTPIYELGNFKFNRGWGNSSQSVTFDVDNPLSATGTLKLNFQRSPDVATDSNVQVALNGEPLDIVELKSSRNSARINIPNGLLVGTDNHLTISPELSPKNAQNSCENQDAISGFSVGPRSYIKVNSTPSDFSGDLTRLSASGYPFSHNSGADTSVVFATRSKRDRAAALRAFAHLGKVYGSGWVDAKFHTLSDGPIGGQNTLYIGPEYNNLAPRELISAIDGRSNRPTTVQTAEFAPSAINLLSLQKPVRGGVMAIYSGDSEGFNGYITTSRGHNFSRSVDQIVEPDHWNKLQGSMARWNGARVEMAKTAFKPVQNTTQEIETTAEESNSGITMPDLSFPEMTMPEVNLPELNLPKVSFEPLKDSFNTASFEANKAIVDFWTGVKMVGDYLGSLKPEPEAPSSPMPAPIAKPKADPQPVMRPVPVPEPRAVFEPKPRIDMSRTSTSTQIRATAPELPIEKISQPVSIVDQYNPGASLRGLSKVETTGPTEAVAPQYQPQGAVTTEQRTGVYEKISGWMTQKLNGLTSSSMDNQKKRQANLMVFAVAIILLLLLLALAKPTPYKNN